ncbi:DNA adenine methylase [Dyadobacter diqingensis]|uniref:DNA adenine methylase n=1 Tax=Dyadobacter diqingensis TaxID=2938121 RepID=UPI0020C243E2|nr:DNA adenine methylase [Dyadobacter diqingensis]
MLPYILPKIPRHLHDIEPFFGGRAVFWAKEPSFFEVVNNINNRIMTFYKVLKYDFEEIEKLVDETFHSRAQHRESDELYISQKNEETKQIESAWSVWVQSNMSFSSMIGGGSVTTVLENVHYAFPTKRTGLLSSIKIGCNALRLKVMMY